MFPKSTTTITKQTMTAKQKRKAGDETHRHHLASFLGQQSFVCCHLVWSLVPIIVLHREYVTTRKNELLVQATCQADEPWTTTYLSGVVIPVFWTASFVTPIFTYSPNERDVSFSFSFVFCVVSTVLSR